MTTLSIHDAQYMGIRREFIFRRDGARAILYPLDYNNTPIHFLLPIQAFVLSLVNGRRRLSDITSTFASLFPESRWTVLDILTDLDSNVRAAATSDGLGQDGLFEVSDHIIDHAPQYDPRDFVLDVKEYNSIISNVKTRFRLSIPINIYIIPTHRCHVDCVYCYADRKATPEMPLSRWREIFDEMAHLGIRFCSPDNGDIFARKDGIDLVEHMLKLKMHFLLSTKIAVSKETIGRLVDAGLTEKVNGVLERQVQLSIDSIDSELGMKILNVKHPRLQQNTETFLNFMSFGIMPIVKCVVTGLNVSQPLPIFEYFYRLGARRFSFVRYTRSMHKHTDNLFVRPEHLPLLREQFAQIRERFPDCELNENLTAIPDTAPTITPDIKQAFWNKRIGCGGGWQALGIGPDGQAFLCEQMAYEPEYFVGDASRQSIMDIWNSKEMFRFIHPSPDQFGDEACASCGEFENCMYEKGRCYRDAYYSYGSVYTQPPQCPKNSRPGIRLS